MAKTRSPTARPLTPSPTARTTPATSPPGENGRGGFTWYLPCAIRMSKKLQPIALTSIATCPLPGCGSGSSRSTMSFGSHHSSTSIACMERGLTAPALRVQPGSASSGALQRCLDAEVWMPDRLSPAGDHHRDRAADGIAEGRAAGDLGDELVEAGVVAVGFDMQADADLLVTR